MITYTIHDWSQHGEEVAFDVEAKADEGPTCRAIVTLAVADDRLVPTFDDVERWVSAPMLTFFTAHSEDPSCEVEDGLLDALFEVVSVDDLDLDRICGACAGSGEGMYDGTRCASCGGSGVPRDYDEEERREAAREDYDDARREERALGMHRED